MTHKSFSYYRVPKALSGPEWDLSLQAQHLYGLMLERVELSEKNGWQDAGGRTYIYFTQQETQERLRCGHNRATAFMRELERAGLIRRKRQGLGKPDMIFVQLLEEGQTPATSKSKTPALRNRKSGETEVLSPAQNQALQSASSGPSSPPETGAAAGPEGAAIHPENNKPQVNQPYPSPPSPPRASRKRSLAEEAWRKTMEETREIIRENIDYGQLLRDRPQDIGVLDGYVELMAEACCSRRPSVRICREEVPTAAVRERLLELERDHLLYVMECVNAAQGRIGNLKAYLLSALYNAPNTMEQYYANAIRRDFGDDLP